MKMLLAAVVLAVVAYAPAIQIAQPVYEDAETLLAAESTHWGPRMITNGSLRLTPTPVAARVLNLALLVAIVAVGGALMARLGWPAWPAALVALHPIATESVMYLSGRAELLAALGMLLACLGAACGWWRPTSLALLMVGVPLALFSKESGAVVLLLVPLTAWCTRRAGPRWALLLVGAVAGAALGWHVATWRVGSLRAFVNADSEARAIEWSTWALAQGGAVTYWLASLVWLPLVTPDADMDRLSMAARLFGLLIVAQCGIVAVTRRSYGAGIVALALAPRLIVQTPGSYLNAHQVLVPWLGLTLCAAELAARIQRVESTA